MILLKGSISCGGRDSWGVWGEHVYTAIFKTDNQQGPA